MTPAEAQVIVDMLDGWSRTANQIDALGRGCVIGDDNWQKVVKLLDSVEKIHRMAVASLPKDS